MARGQEGASACRHAGQTRVCRGAGNHTAEGTAALLGRALDAYCDGIACVLRNVVRPLRPGAPVLIVVNDRRDLYPQILERAGLVLDDRLRRHVNRRTGRRAGEFYEDVLVTRAT